MIIIYKKVNPMTADEILAKLSQAGHRITRQRTVVVEIVADSACLQSAEEIYRRCKERDDSISFPTIYRTLDMLVESDVVRRLHFGRGRSWYEPVRRHGHHHHLACLECGAVAPVDACPGQLIREAAGRYGFKVLDHQFEILGICKECQEKELSVG